MFWLCFWGNQDSTVGRIWALKMFPNTRGRAPKTCEGHGTWCCTWRFSSMLELRPWQMIYFFFVVCFCWAFVALPDGPVIWRMLTYPPTRRALLVGCGLHMFQQVSGINTIMWVKADILVTSPLPQCGVQDKTFWHIHTRDVQGLCCKPIWTTFLCLNCHRGAAVSVVCVIDRTESFLRSSNHRQ